MVKHRVSSPNNDIQSTGKPNKQGKTQQIQETREQEQPQVIITGTLACDCDIGDRKKKPRSFHAQPFLK